MNHNINFAIGDRVVISDEKHPWYRCAGEITASMTVPLPRQASGFRVELDNGMSSFCRPEQIYRA